VRWRRWVKLHLVGVLYCIALHCIAWLKLQNICLGKGVKGGRGQDGHGTITVHWHVSANMGVCMRVDTAPCCIF
jgi:hypothetical protein